MQAHPLSNTAAKNVSRHFTDAGNLLTQGRKPAAKGVVRAC